MTITETMFTLAQLPEFNLNSCLQNQYFLYFIHYTAIFLVNIVSYAYIFLKFFKAICYSKMTLEWFPLVNPYLWPFSIFQVLSGPYFSFWANILPAIKFEKSSLDISGIIALEAINSFIYFCVKLTNTLLFLLQETDKLVNIPK